MAFIVFKPINDIADECTLVHNVNWVDMYDGTLSRILKACRPGPGEGRDDIPYTESQGDGNGVRTKYPGFVSEVISTIKPWIEISDLMVPVKRPNPNTFKFMCRTSTTCRELLSSVLQEFGSVDEKLNKKRKQQNGASASVRAPNVDGPSFSDLLEGAKDKDIVYTEDKRLALYSMVRMFEPWFYAFRSAVRAACLKILSNLPEYDPSRPKASLNAVFKKYNAVYDSLDEALDYMDAVLRKHTPIATLFSGQCYVHRGTDMRTVLRDAFIAMVDVWDSLLYANGEVLGLLDVKNLTKGFKHLVKSLNGVDLDKYKYIQVWFSPNVGIRYPNTTSSAFYARINALHNLAFRLIFNSLNTPGLNTFKIKNTPDLKYNYFRSNDPVRCRHNLDPIDSWREVKPLSFAHLDWSVFVELFNPVKRDAKTGDIIVVGSDTCFKPGGKSDRFLELRKELCKGAGGRHDPTEEECLDAFEAADGINDDPNSWPSLMTYLSDLAYTLNTDLLFNQKLINQKDNPDNNVYGISLGIYQTESLDGKSGRKPVKTIAEVLKRTGFVEVRNFKLGLKLNKSDPFDPRYAQSPVCIPVTLPFIALPKDKSDKLLNLISDAFFNGLKLNSVLTVNLTDKQIYNSGFYKHAVKLAKSKPGKGLFITPTKPQNKKADLLSECELFMPREALRPGKVMHNDRPYIVSSKRFAQLYHDIFNHLVKSCDELDPKYKTLFTQSVEFEALTVSGWLGLERMFRSNPDFTASYMAFERLIPPHMENRNRTALNGQAGPDDDDAGRGFENRTATSIAMHSWRSLKFNLTLDMDFGENFTDKTNALYGFLKSIALDTVRNGWDIYNLRDHQPTNGDVDRLEKLITGSMLKRPVNDCATRNGLMKDDKYKVYTAFAVNLGELYARMTDRSVDGFSLEADPMVA